MRMTGTYYPCEIGAALGTRLRSWEAPMLPIRSLLDGRHIDLIKLDIDSKEGALVGVIHSLLAERRLTVEAILVELGDWHSAFAGCEVSGNRDLQLCRLRGKPKHRSEHRGLQVRNLWGLQHELGFHIYRINTHVNREIYDWRGKDINERKTQQQMGFIPLEFVRGMRKLELLSRDWPVERYDELLRNCQSLLLTREAIHRRFVRPHDVDLMFAMHLGGSTTTSSTEAKLAVKQTLNNFSLT